MKGGPAFILSAAPEAPPFRRRGRMAADERAPLLAAPPAGGEMAGGGGRGEGTRRSRGRVFMGAASNLSLAVVGSTVLPIGQTFAITGVVPGVLIGLAVMLANAYTSVILLRVGRHMRAQKPELGALAFAFGGAQWRLVVDVAQALLLFGGNCGNLALQGELWTYAIRPSSDGTADPLVLAVATVGFVFPLCCFRSMRALETYASAGNLLLVGLAVAVFAQAARQNFPLRHSAASWVNSKDAVRQWPLAFAQLGFDFYLAPQLLPLLHEAHLDAQPVARGAIVALVFAFTVYALVGSCQVLRIGSAATDNLFADMHVAGLPGQLLAGALAVFLAFGYAPVLFALRYSVLSWRDRGSGGGGGGGGDGGGGAEAAGDEEGGPAVASTECAFFAHIGSTFVLVMGSMCVAFFYTGNADLVFALTGATGAYVICFLVPCVAAHRLLPATGEGATAPPVLISVVVCVAGGVMSAIAVVAALLQHR